jgi:NAD(P)-dependent dehydrogenase (short-subunit alcohol dehydrogenase family)
MADLGAALITGAAGTIGSTVARLMAARGHPVVLVDRDETALWSLAASIKGATAIVADLARADEVATLFRQPFAGGLAAVILATGTEGPVGLLEDCPEDQFDAVMSLNVKSVWLGLRESLRIMKQQGNGSVVVLSSISSVMAMPMLSPYAASKHAVMGLVRTAAREAAAAGVRVNAVCPAPVESGMMKRIDGALQAHFPERLRGAADASKSVPLQRYARPSEVADAIAYLCSDAASYCTGMAFMVDGGISCR